MLPEPTSTSAAAAAFAASLSGVTLALFGVEYHALLWAFVGAMLAVASASQMSNGKAVARVVLTTLVGAALGSGVLAFFETSKPAVLIVLSLAGGYGADQLVGRLLEALGKRIDRIGGA